MTEFKEEPYESCERGVLVCKCPVEALEAFSVKSSGQDPDRLSAMSCVHESATGPVVIKERKQELTPATVELFRAIDLVIADTGLTAKRVYPQDSNDPLFESESGLLYEATRYIGNHPRFDWLVPKWNEKHCHSMGQIVRRFHESSPRISAQLTAETQQDLTSVLPQIPTNLESRLARPDVAAAFSSSWRNHLNACAIAAFERVADTKSPRVLVHGDLHPGNVLFSNEEAMALIDFDFAHFEPIEYDLAYAAIMVSLPTSSHSALRIETARSFLDGYRSAAIHAPIWLTKPINKVLKHLEPYTQLCAILIFLWILDQGEVEASPIDKTMLLFHALSYWLDAPE